VLSHHAAPRDGWTESIVVDVLRPLKGHLSGQVRLYGSGRGDCTVQATNYPVAETFLFVLARDFPQPLEGKPGYGLYGVCGAVSGSLRDGTVEAVLQTTPRAQARKTATMPLALFLRQIDSTEDAEGRSH